MILHLLHSPALFDECTALLTEHDTLLLLDEAADDTFIGTLTPLPCASAEACRQSRKRPTPWPREHHGG